MPVRFERADSHPHVAVVVIDRPERANCLDPAMLAELASTWRRIAADDDVRCAVLRGAGDRVFCSGMDMRATIPAAQRLARGERVSEEEFRACAPSARRCSRASTCASRWCARSTATHERAASI
jgi:enoyl-CoA hydratase/carnithine racemase